MSAPHILATRGEYDGSPEWYLRGDREALARFETSLPLLKGWGLEGDAESPIVLRGRIGGSVRRVERALVLRAAKLGLVLAIDTLARPSAPRISDTIPCGAPDGCQAAASR